MAKTDAEFDYQERLRSTMRDVVERRRSSIMSFHSNDDLYGEEEENDSQVE